MRSQRQLVTLARNPLLRFNLQQPLLIINRVAAPFNLYSGCVPMSFSCINKIIKQSWDNLIDRSHSHCLFRTYKYTCYCLAFTCVWGGWHVSVGAIGFRQDTAIVEFLCQRVWTCMNVWKSPKNSVCYARTNLFSFPYVLTLMRIEKSLSNSYIYCIPTSPF